MFKEKEQTRRTLNALQWKMDLIEVILNRLEDQSKKMDKLLDLMPKPLSEEQIKELQAQQQQQQYKMQKLIDEYLG